MASISPVSATTVVYFFKDSNNVIVFSCDVSLITSPLLPAHRGGGPVAFDLSNLGQPPAMAFCSAKPGAEEVLRAVPGDCDTCGSASKADYVHVVILDSLSGGKIIVAKCRSHAHDLVGGHGRSHSAAAHKDPAVHVSPRHSSGQRDGKVGVVVIVVINLTTEVNHLVAFRGQQLHQLLFHFKSTVIGADTHFHFALPCRAIWLLAAATTCSAVMSNFFSNCLSGADAPNVSMQMLCPSEPVYLLQPKSEACSTDTRAFTLGGRT